MFSTVPACMTLPFINRTSCERWIGLCICLQNQIFLDRIDGRSHLHQSPFNTLSMSSRPLYQQVAQKE